MNTSTKPEAGHLSISDRGALRSSSIAEILRRAEAGERLGVADAQSLLGATGKQLERLLEAAGSLRDTGLEAAGRPKVITYSRKVFLPLTTLCRDRCHYCVFVDTPRQLLKKNEPAYMSPEQVLAVARQGQALGCKEALLTLGDRPEDRWPEARAWLDQHGYASTLDYVGAIARLVTAETGLLAHANPGVMHTDELAALRAVAPSMGMMLETTSRRLYEEPGQVHFGSPDKEPALRLRVIENAGRLRVPFTTGILVGIGETLRDRAESLVALRDVHARHGHLQEIIVQNFRAKSRTAMQAAPDADRLEYVAAVATARLIFGPDMRIQVPPNLSDRSELALLVRAGIDDWGGVSPLTADHVNPERPWPHLDDLARATADLGFELRERLTAHPEFVTDPARWLDPALRAPVAALAGSDGLAAEVIPESALDASFHAPGSRGDRLTGSDAQIRRQIRPGSGAKGRGTVARLAEEAAADPLSLDDDAWERMMRAEGADLDLLTETADAVRRYTVGEAVSLVANRNVTSTGFRGDGRTNIGEFDLADAAAIAADAVELGATELCIQGIIPGDPAAYSDLIRAVKYAEPDIHVHAYRPQDVWDLADRAGLGLAGALAVLRDAGVDTMAGTGVKILSERVRREIAPADLEIDRWREGIRAAHQAGFRTTSVLFYGHVETAAERIAHLRELRDLQARAPRNSGFSEFVPIPLPGFGVPLVTGRPAIAEHRAMVAVSRLLLTGSIPHVQIAWTRVGREAAAVLLRAGGDDLGGTLFDGRVLPDTGAERGLELPVSDAARIAARLFRPFRQRTTDYGTRLTVVRT